MTDIKLKYVNNRLIYDDRVKFDYFRLYRPDNAHKEEQTEEYDYISKEWGVNDWEAIVTHICPHCIKKYGLYKETRTTEEYIEELIKRGVVDTRKSDFNEWSLGICGVGGCYNEADEYSWGNSGKSMLIVKEDVW